MRNTRSIAALSLSLIAIVACADDYDIEASVEDQAEHQDPEPEGVCIAPARAPSEIEFSYVDGERPDGTIFYGASATFTLSSGDVGEANILVESDGSGEAYLAINGTIVSQAAISADEYIDEEPVPPTVHTWTPTDLSYSGELIAELLQGDIGDTMINGMVPQEFKCSRFGRKVLKAGKYMWVGAVAAAGTACCAAFQAGCLFCIGAAAAGAEAGADAADGYCD